MVSTKQYVAALDIGTTNVRCCVYDKQANLVASHSKELSLLSPERFASEFDPNHVWTSVQEVIKTCFNESNGNVSVHDVAALGLATHRNTFLLWDKQSGKALHNFITWKDNRASAVTRQMNNMTMIRMIRTVAGAAYFLTGSKRILLAKIVNFMNAMVVTRLMWLMQTDEKLAAGISDGSVMYGCLESWLLCKLSGGKLKTSETDVSLASATGLLDPFTVDWSYGLMRIVGAPTNILPNLNDTSCHFVDCDSKLFGASIPVTTITGDQHAAMYGTGCVNEGDIMLSLGTGAFIDINTGANAHTSMQGLYPIVGWRLAGHVTYLAEAHCHDMATAIHWARLIGLFNDVSESACLAQSVPDSGGVYFIPAFSGLQAPINDPMACTAFIGMNENSTKAHMTRAVLESVAFRLYQIYSVLLDECNCDDSIIRCCGGVSSNDFVCSTVAVLCDRPVQRVQNGQFAAAFGAAFLAGQFVDFWPSKSSVNDFVVIERTFEPEPAQRPSILSTYTEWERAVQRTLKWYKEHN